MFLELSLRFFSSFSIDSDCSCLSAFFRFLQFLAVYYCMICCPSLYSAVSLIFIIMLMFCIPHCSCMLLLLCPFMKHLVLILELSFQCRFFIFSLCGLLFLLHTIKWVSRLMYISLLFHKGSHSLILLCFLDCLFNLVLLLCYDTGSMKLSLQVVRVVRDKNYLRHVFSTLLCCELSDYSDLSNSCYYTNYAIQGLFRGT